MDTHFPEIPDPKPAGRRAARRQPLTVRYEGHAIDVVDFSGRGFAIARDAPPLGRGFVDLYRGESRFCHGLGYQTRVEGDCRHYDFKSLSLAGDVQPSDYAHDRAAIAALIAGPGGS